MRNLKKLLALTLAMVMAFSMMLTASAAVKYDDYQDKDQITEEFKEAVQVLTGLKVMQGDEKDGVKGFRPGDTLTRAEAAAIIYRVATGDVADTQVKIYADYGTFSDVNRDDWFAGYVGYCQNAGYIKGHANRFNPYGKVTGYEMLAMILRVVGYGKNNEFTGGEWQVNVASRAKELGVTDNVKNANFETTLNYAARRDVVADLAFQTMVKVPTVTWSQALGYSDRPTMTTLGKNATLGQKTFGLWCEGVWKEVDKWGTPGYYWVKGGTYNANNGYDPKTLLPIYTNTVVSNPSDSGYNVIATITPVPTKTYDNTVRECDVAHDLDFAVSENFKLHVNDKAAITDKYLVVATDTVTRVGGQGRITKFWYDVTSPFAGDLDPWCTMVDTYLAKVTKVTPVVKDPAGHIIQKAQLTMDVYDGNGVGEPDTNVYGADRIPNATKNASTHTAVKNTDWEYSVGDYVLIQGYTDKTQGDAAWVAAYNALATVTTLKNPVDKTENMKAVAGNLYGTGSTKGPGLNALNHNPSVQTGAVATFGVVVSANDQLEARNRAAFEANILGADDTKIDVLHKAEPKLAKQTITYWNAGKHQVDGTDYNDQMTLFLDYAGTTTGTTYAWYFDDNTNIIGIGPVTGTVNYGVITSIWTSFTQGDGSTDGTAKTFAKVKYADDTEATIEITKFLVSGTATVAGDPSTGGHASLGDGLAAAGMFSGTDSNNPAAQSVQLTPVYDYMSQSGAAANTMMSSANAGRAANEAAQSGQLYVAPVASINTAQDSNGENDGHFGIVKGNLYKFVGSENGKYTAIEVSGNGNGADKLYGGHYAYDANTNAADSTMSKLYKSLGFISVTGRNGAAICWLDDQTKIMVNNGAKTSTGARNTASERITVYDGLNDLPSDITIEASSEIDWADTDGDGRAEFLYLTGKVDGAITYGLFYYNGGAAQWNGTSGTLTGWLNGEATTITFTNENEFKTVKDSQGYSAHLFALQLTDGVVTDVMQAENAKGNQGKFILADYSGSSVANTSNTVLDFAANPASDTEATNIRTSGVWATASNFKVGTLGGNAYAVNTEAVYYNDVKNGTDDVSYDNTKQIVNVASGGSYKITPNTKIFGLGMGVTQGEAVLEYLTHSEHNDVTIVYDNNSAKSIIEIYVATDPNVTPPSTDTTYSASLAIDPTHGVVLNVKSTDATDTALFNAKVYSYSVGSNSDAAVEVSNFSQNLVAGNWGPGVTGVASPSRYVYFYAEVTIGGQTITTNTVIGDK